MARTEKVVIELDVDNSKANTKLKQSTDQVKKGAQEVNASTEQLTSSLDKVSGGAVSMFASFKNGLRTAVAGFTTLRGAIAATGIGALILAFTSLLSFFTKTERGAQALRVVTAGLEAAFGSVSDVIVSLGENIFKAFNDPKKALEDLGDNVQYYFTEFIPNAFQKVLDGLGLLGDAISELFAGNFEAAANKATEGALKLGDGLLELNPAGAVIKSLVEGTAELGNEIAKDVKAATELEDALNKVKVRERELNVERAQNLATINELRFAAQDQTKSLEERISALSKAAALEKRTTEEELKNEEERLRILKEQANLNESDEKTLENIAQQEIRVANIRASSAALNRRLLTELNSLRNQAATEEAAAAKAKADADAAALKLQQDQAKAKADAAAKQAAEELQNAIETQNKIDALRIQLIEDAQEKELAISAQKYDLLFEQAKGNAELENLLLEAQQQEALGIRQKYLDLANEAENKANQEREQAEKNLQDARFQAAFAVNEALLATGLVSAKQSFNIAKALNITEATINGIQAVQKTLAQGGVLATPLAIAMGVTTAANVAKIAAQKFNSSAGASAGSSASIPSLPTTEPRANATNLSDIIGQQNNPVKAYVVATDVANANEANNKIKQQSTL